MARIVFMGTPHFAVPTLELLTKEHEVVAVVTVPDKPQGRGLKMHYSAVKEKAIELGLNILQPEKLKDEDYINSLKALNADIFCVVAFRILPKEVFTLPKYGSFNIHGSLLPKYRGAAPINWAIIKGEQETGLTSFILNEKVDTGNILLYKKVLIDEYTTAGILHDRLQAIAPKLAIETCQMIINGNYTPLKQDDSLATPAPKIFKQDCIISFKTDAQIVANFIHGLSPYPGAFTYIHENGTKKQLKIISCKLAEYSGKEGSFEIKEKKFIIYCADKAIEVIELQLEGKKQVGIKDFLNGWRGEHSGILG
jgi:methionyl-tRNA formyltransferase